MTPRYGPELELKNGEKVRVDYSKKLIPLKDIPKKVKDRKLKTLKKGVWELIKKKKLKKVKKN